MFAKLLLIEKDALLRKDMQRALAERGFTDIESFEDTDDISNRIAGVYDRPCILVVEYFTPPQTPRLFTPELRARGIDMPFVVMSERLAAGDLNSLHLIGNYRGYFQKEFGLARPFLHRIAQHVAELQVEAMRAWEHFQTTKAVQAFLQSTQEGACPERQLAHLVALRGVLEMKEPKSITFETDLSPRHMVRMRQALRTFAADNLASKFYPVMLHEIGRKIEVLCARPASGGST